MSLISLSSFEKRLYFVLIVFFVAVAIIGFISPVSASITGGTSVPFEGGGSSGSSFSTSWVYLYYPSSMTWDNVTIEFSDGVIRSYDKGTYFSRNIYEAVMGRTPNMTVSRGDILRSCSYYMGSTTQESLVFNYGLGSSSGYYIDLGFTLGWLPSDISYRAAVPGSQDEKGHYTKWERSNYGQDTSGLYIVNVVFNGGNSEDYALPEGSLSVDESVVHVGSPVEFSYTYAHVPLNTSLILSITETPSSSLNYNGLTTLITSVSNESGSGTYTWTMPSKVGVNYTCELYNGFRLLDSINITSTDAIPLNETQPFGYISAIPVTLNLGESVKLDYEAYNLNGTSLFLDFTDNVNSPPFWYIRHLADDVICASGQYILTPETAGNYTVRLRYSGSFDILDTTSFTVIDTNPTPTPTATPTPTPTVTPTPTPTVTPTPTPTVTPTPTPTPPPSGSAKGNLTISNSHPPAGSTVFFTYNYSSLGNKELYLVIFDDTFVNSFDGESILLESSANSGEGRYTWRLPSTSNITYTATLCFGNSYVTTVLDSVTFKSGESSAIQISTTSAWLGDTIKIPFSVRSYNNGYMDFAVYRPCDGDTPISLMSKSSNFFNWLYYLFSPSYEFEGNYEYTFDMKGEYRFVVREFNESNDGYNVLAENTVMVYDESDISIRYDFNSTSSTYTMKLQPPTDDLYFRFSFYGYFEGVSGLDMNNLANAIMGTTDFEGRLSACNIDDLSLVEGVAILDENSPLYFGDIRYRDKLYCSPITIENLPCGYFCSDGSWGDIKYTIKIKKFDDKTLIKEDVFLSSFEIDLTTDLLPSGSINAPSSVYAGQTFTVSYSGSTGFIDSGLNYSPVSLVHGWYGSNYKTEKTGDSISGTLTFNFNYTGNYCIFIQSGNYYLKTANITVLNPSGGNYQDYSVYKEFWNLGSYDGTYDISNYLEAVNFVSHLSVPSSLVSVWGCVRPDQFYLIRGEPDGIMSQIDSVYANTIGFFLSCIYNVLQVLSFPLVFIFNMTSGVILATVDALSWCVNQVSIPSQIFAMILNDLVPDEVKNVALALFGLDLFALLVRIVMPNFLNMSYTIESLHNHKLTAQAGYNIQAHREEFEEKAKEGIRYYTDLNRKNNGGGN